MSLMAKQMLRSSNFWIINKSVVHGLGSIEAAFLLSVLADAEAMMADEEGWFYQTIDTLRDLTTLSRRKQDAAIKLLIEAGVLKQENRGSPPRRYFKLQYEQLFQIVQNGQIELYKTDKSNCAKRTTINKVSNKQSIDKDKELSCKSLTIENARFIMREYNRIYADFWKQELRLTDRRKTMIYNRLKSFTVGEIVMAMENLRLSDYHVGQSSNNSTFYAKPEFIFRNDDKIDEWMNKATGKGGAENDYSIYDRLSKIR